MDKEFKIVGSIFMLFLIFGISSIYYNGVFVTPIFLNQLVLLGVAIAFFLMNTKAKGAWILALYIPVQLMACMIDGFTMAFLESKIGGEIWLRIYESFVLGICFIVCYFAFMIFLPVKAFLLHKNRIWLSINLVFLIASLVLLFNPLLSPWRDMSFFLFIISFFFTIMRYMPENNRVYEVMATQLLLLFFLEGIEYFH